jgi:predicted RND superfamily exporter protein
MFSAHRGVASMGILLSLAIGFTLICTILVQPWLLDKLGAGKSKPKIPVI